MNKEIKEFVKKVNTPLHIMNNKQLLEFENELVEYKEIIEKLNKTNTHLYNKIIHILKGVKFEKSFRKL